MLFVINSECYSKIPMTTIITINIEISDIGNLLISVTSVNYKSIPGVSACNNKQGIYTFWLLRSGLSSLVSDNGLRISEWEPNVSQHPGENFFIKVRVAHG